jgi:hypothetical protein
VIMGLDCYFRSQEPVSFPENGLLSQCNDQLNSFSGRRYAPFVAALSGCDLYEEKLDVVAIQQIAAALRGKLAEYQEYYSAPDLLIWRSNEGRYCDITLHQLQQLVIVFEFASAQGLSLFNHS